MLLSFLISWDGFYVNQYYEAHLLQRDNASRQRLHKVLELREVEFFIIEYAICIFYEKITINLSLVHEIIIFLLLYVAFEN